MSQPNLPDRPGVTLPAVPTVTQSGIQPSSTPLMEGVANASAKDFGKHWGAVGSATPAEALASDPRKNPVKP